MFAAFRRSRLLAALLLGLALLHADPGGLTYCIARDGTVRVEFDCACLVPSGAGCSCCAADADVPPSGDLILCAADGCTDISISLLAATKAASPAAPLLTSVVPAIVAAPEPLRVAGCDLSGPATIDPPPLLHAAVASTVLRI
jgi:hypothetical protein